MNFKNNKKTVLAAMLLAIGIVLPLCTAQVKEIGDSLLPMHIPVMLCGFICGPQYGVVVGFILPFLRGVTFGMPPLYPNAVWMAFELATYGGITGFLYTRKKRSGIGYLYFCLITAMISGRIVWGIVKTVLLGMGGKAFTLQAFLAGGLLDAIPGIILQIVVIPFLVAIINRRKRDIE